MTRSHPLTIAALAAACAVPASAAAGPTTLDQTVVPTPGAGRPRMALGPGDGHTLRTPPGARPSSSRRQQRRSLFYFAHITDTHLVDEASPARMELLAPGGGLNGTLWRPGEALLPQVLDRTVRAVNANVVSPLTGAGGSRARLRLALVTGDLADNAQRNEVRWAVRILDGGTVDPFSGARLSARNRCPGASPAARRKLNRAVARRLYMGVQDYSDWPRRPAVRYRSFWDPGARPPGAGRWARLPRHPGLLERAQRRFRAAGLAVPWYSARGNHDATAQGIYGPPRAWPRSVAVGCRKVMPARALSPHFRRSPWELLRRGLTQRPMLVPPDRRRRMIRSAGEFKRLHGRADRRHGFGFTPRAQLRASRGNAAYYAFSPQPGLRLVALDTASDVMGPGGNLDHPQYLWLRRQLRAAARRRQLVIVFGHHPLDTLTNPKPDELIGRLDRDPRRSTPLHFGLGGRASLRSLLLRHPPVVLYLTGHKHRNEVWPHVRGSGGRGFWEMTTASLVGAPQQARLIELMDNGDGTLSILGTMVDHSPPQTPPAGTPGAHLNHVQLGSLGRLLASAWSRPGARARERGAGAHNVELVLRDPRR